MFFFPPIALCKIRNHRCEIGKPLKCVKSYLHFFKHFPGSQSKKYPESPLLSTVASPRYWRNWGVLVPVALCGVLFHKMYEIYLWPGDTKVTWRKTYVYFRNKTQSDSTVTSLMYHQHFFHNIHFRNNKDKSNFCAF